MRRVYDKRRKLMVELMREVGFVIPVMPQGAFYVFADASRWTDDSYQFIFDLLEKAGVGIAPGVDFSPAGKRAMTFSYASSEEGGHREVGGVFGKTRVDLWRWMPQCAVGENAAIVRKILGG